MRYLTRTIAEFSARKFVLLAGPRQVGKTTLAKQWLESLRGRYLNWDAAEDREAILKRDYLRPYPPAALLLDEIHKYPRWKGYLKGLYDKESKRLQLVVTGSARLDLYQRGGDSLFGRYELLRLHPFSVGELAHGQVIPPPADWLNCRGESGGENTGNEKAWRRLAAFGGFPEPHTLADPFQHQRWSLRRRELIIKEDLQDLTDVRLVELVEHLFLLLPSRIGAPLSINSLRQELSVSFNTVSSWISILERLYICYRLSPYHDKIARSLRKEQKLYLWDWSQVPDPAARFENMVAGHLLKNVHAWNDLGYGDFELHYWRSKQKEEVDFVITNKRKAIAVVECKLADTGISHSLVKLAAALGDIPAIQLVEEPGIQFRKGSTLVVSADLYLALFT